MRVRRLYRISQAFTPERFERLILIRNYLLRANITMQFREDDSLYILHLIVLVIKRFFY